MCQKLKTVNFINMWLFILKIEIFNFCICQKNTFAWSDLEQASSWWINSKFCVYKVSIWRCQFILTFSGLHFFILYDPLEFSTGAWPNPSGLEMAKTHHCGLPCLMAADKPFPQLQPSLPWPKTDGFWNLVRFWVVPLSVKESISS